MDFAPDLEAVGNIQSTKNKSDAKGLYLTRALRSLCTMKICWHRLTAAEAAIEEVTVQGLTDEFHVEPVEVTRG